MTAPVAVSDPVRDALARGGAVVALETSVLAQGLPSARGLEAAERMDQAIAAQGAVPAWIGVRDGSVRVGLDRSELEHLAEAGAAAKVARRDVPVVLAAGGLGATTVSATVWAAHRVGIAVAATGGIGGVHPGSGDVSADLAELAGTRILLVCSGPKSIVDPVATAERLEELGVSLVGYRCDRLPFFVVREAPVDLEHRVDDPAAAAALVRAQRELGIPSAIVLCDPVPPGAAMDAAEVAEAVLACEDRAAREGVRGKDVTPYLLRCVAERTGGASLEANLALLGSNAGLAAEIAVALAADARAT
jgi:pseudouridine-5'-phosphate glycosidase